MPSASFQRRWSFVECSYSYFPLPDIFIFSEMPEYEEELHGTCHERILVYLGWSTTVYLTLWQDYPGGMLFGSWLFIFCLSATCLSAISLFFLRTWVGKIKNEGQEFLLLEAFIMFFWHWIFYNWLLWCFDILCCLGICSVHTHTQLDLFQEWFIHIPLFHTHHIFHKNQR